MKKWLWPFAIIFMISGCGTNDEATDQNNEGLQTLEVKNSTIENANRKTGQEIANHLVKLASDIPNVNDATAVVLGPYSIVGIDVNEDIDRSQVGSIKYTVAETLRKDPHGAKALVVADPDITARLKEIREDIQAGKPVQGIINELADISGRIMPEVPADLNDPNESSDEQKEKLDKQERKTFDKQQEKQSKGQ